MTTVAPMTTSGGSARKSWLRGPQRRRLYCFLAAGWLALAVLAIFQWLGADDSTGRWLAGVQVVLGLALAITYLVWARHIDSGGARD